MGKLRVVQKNQPFRFVPLTPGTPNLGWKKPISPCLILKIDRFQLEVDPDTDFDFLSRILDLLEARSCGI